MELSNQLPGSHPLTAPDHPPERVTGPPELHHSEGRYPHLLSGLRTRHMVHRRELSGGTYLAGCIFYATHRLFHHPKLYLWAHHGHHRSQHPSPWTSFAFDHVESAAHALFLIVIVLTIPLHLITILVVLTTMSVWAVVNHLGIERLPVRFPHHWLGHWMIGPAHHSIHHQRQNLHYGLYFTFWDRVFGTEDRGYASKIKKTNRTIFTYSSGISAKLPLSLDKCKIYH
jgi:hypothetical protein